MGQMRNRTEATDKPCGFLSIDIEGFRVVVATLDSWEVNSRESHAWQATFTGTNIDRTVGHTCYLQCMVKDTVCWIGKGRVVIGKTNDVLDYVFARLEEPAYTFVAESPLTYLIIPGKQKTGDASRG